LVSVNLAEKIIMVAVLRSVALYIRLLNILPAGLACSRLDRLLPYRAPRRRGPRCTYWPTQAYAGTTVFLGVGPVANENQSELRGILTSSFIIIRSGIVTVAIDFDVWSRLFNSS